MTDSKVQSIAVNKQVLSNKNLSKNDNEPTFTLFDFNHDKAANIDPYDKTPDISHPEAVALYVKSECQKAKEVPLKSFDSADVIVAPVGVEIPISQLAKATNLPLTRENLSEYKDKIAEYLRQPDLSKIKDRSKQSAADFDYQFRMQMNLNVNPDVIGKTFATLESLSQLKPVYVSAGNNGKNSVNLLSFAKGVKNVGSMTQYDSNTPFKSYFSADNSLVTDWARGHYPIYQIKDPQGKVLGYNITNGSNVEIPVSKVSSNPKSEENSTVHALLSGAYKKVTGSYYDVSETGSIEGTSFSAPTKAGEFLRAKFGSACGD